MTKPRAAGERPFGAESRSRLLDQYFGDAGPLTTENAWKHVYRLLAWIDRTTGLAHCYESDKAQPGRPWYARTLAFHDWLSMELEVPPRDLHAHVDWLFRHASRLLAAIERRQEVARADRVAEQRAPYGDRDLPLPGEDPTLEEIVRSLLERWLADRPDMAAMRELSESIQKHWRTDNKRKNLVGEGFEDTLVQMISRLDTGGRLLATARAPLHEIPGFAAPREREKQKKVDVAVVAGDRRCLVSAKWSVRADREEQFSSDFEAYTRLETAGRDFDYVLVTNEFDAARVVAACENRQPNANLFTSVVHVNPQGLNVVYRSEPASKSKSWKRLEEHVASGRLTSLSKWLESLL